MQLFRFAKLFPNSRVFLFVILKEVVPHTIDKFHSIQTLFIPTNFYDTSIHDSTTVIALSTRVQSHILNIRAMRAKKDRLIASLVTPPPPHPSPFVVETFDRFVHHGRGQSTSLLLLKSVFGGKFGNRWVSKWADHVTSAA